MAGDSRRKSAGGKELEDMKTRACTLPLGESHLNTSDVECATEEEVLIENRGVGREWTGISASCVRAGGGVNVSKLADGVVRNGGYAVAHRLEREV